MRVRALMSCLLATWFGSALASAQEPPAPAVGPPPTQAAPEGIRSERTTVSLDAGYSTADYSSGSRHMNGGSMGATVARDLGRRFGIEASGAYLGRGAGADALSLSANLLLYLRSNREKVSPYLSVGGGLYRASFDMGNPRFSGSMGNGMMGSGYGAGGNGMMGNGGGMMGYGAGHGMQGTGYGPQTASRSGGYGQMPMFYGNRMDGMMGSGNRSFNDPAVSLGGGVRIDLGSKLDLRPEARALVVTSDGDTYTVGLLTVSLGYRF